MDSNRVVLKMNFNQVRIENRQVRDGNALLFQGRRVEITPEGDSTSSDWDTLSRITNYGDVYDKKPSKFSRILRIMLE
jgi:hypothetical protein